MSHSPSFVGIRMTLTTKLHCENQIVSQAQLSTLTRAGYQMFRWLWRWHLPSAPLSRGLPTCGVGLPTCAWLHMSPNWRGSPPGGRALGLVCWISYPPASVEHTWPDGADLYVTSSGCHVTRDFITSYKGTSTATTIHRLQPNRLQFRLRLHI